MSTHAFLGSASLAAAPAWLQELPRHPAGVVMVPTAGNRLDSTPWVNATVALLEACGMTVRMLDLEAADPTETAAAVSATDLVWVTGGHPWTSASAHDDVHGTVGEGQPVQVTAQERALWHPDARPVEHLRRAVHAEDPVAPRRQVGGVPAGAARRVEDRAGRQGLEDLVHDGLVGDPR